MLDEVALVTGHPLAQNPRARIPPALRIAMPVLGLVSLDVSATPLSDDKISLFPKSITAVSSAICLIFGIYDGTASERAGSDSRFIFITLNGLFSSSAHIFGHGTMVAAYI